jgi:hypothetical protein
MKIDWKNLNKVRVHNKNETVKHFMAKAMVLKIFFNAGYECYTEVEIGKRVADVLVLKYKTLPTIIELETKVSDKHNKDLTEYYGERDMNIYVIGLHHVPEDLKKMEDYLRYKFGL